MRTPFRVDRVAASEMPQRTCFIALHTDYSEEYEPDTALPEDRCGIQCVEKLLKGGRGHWGPLEHPSLTLAMRADTATVNQLTRHRFFSFDVQSMRYTGDRISKVASRQLLPEDVFYSRPPGHYIDRFGNNYEWTQEQVDESEAIAYSSALDYERQRQKGVAHEQARHVLICSYYQNLIATGSLRSWLHLLDVRLLANAQSEIQELMELVALEIKLWAPEIYEWWEKHRRGKAMLAP